MTWTWTQLETPIGTLLVAGDDAGLECIRFPVDNQPAKPQPGWIRDDRALHAARVQLRAYFEGDLRSFDLPLSPQGTAFQHEVWALLAEIPYGTTVSYGALAHRLGKPGSARAVGHANGRNPLPIVLPCHRVVGTDGSLTGFGGGLAVKRWLLRHEGVEVAQQTTLF